MIMRVCAVFEGSVEGNLAARGITVPEGIYYPIRLSRFRIQFKKSE